MSKKNKSKKHTPLLPSLPKSEKKGDDYVLKADCHKGNVFVFADPQCPTLRLHGGGTTRDAYLPSGWIGIDLANGIVPLVDVLGVQLPHFCPAPIKRIRIYWQDFSDCDLDRTEWLALVADLRAIAQMTNKPTNVLVCCVGGHGRTGSALSILAALMGASGKTCPVTWVRNHYCSKAVESSKQLDYIEKMAEVEVTAKPAKVVTTTPTYGYGNWEECWKEWDVKHPSATLDATKQTSQLPLPPVSGTVTQPDWNRMREEVTCRVCQGPKVGGYCTPCRQLEHECTCMDIELNPYGY